jgi:hypothetical protein
MAHGLRILEKSMHGMKRPISSDSFLNLPRGLQHQHVTVTFGSTEHTNRDGCLLVAGVNSSAQVMDRNLLLLHTEGVSGGLCPL